MSTKLITINPVMLDLTNTWPLLKLSAGSVRKPHRSRNMEQPFQVYHAIAARTANGVFSWIYRYKAWQPGVKDDVVNMALDGAGVRETQRALHIGLNMVIRTLKKSRT